MKKLFCIISKVVSYILLRVGGNKVYIVTAKEMYDIGRYTSSHLELAESY